MFKQVRSIAKFAFVLRHSLMILFTLKRHMLGQKGQHEFLVGAVICIKNLNF
jgi:hypothetical protein